MEVRLTVPVATRPAVTRSAVTRRVWRRAVLATAGASLAAVTVAGCTGGGPSSVFTPTPQISATSHSGAVGDPLAVGDGHLDR